MTFSYDNAGNTVRQVSCAPQPAHADCTAAADASQQPMVQFDYGWAEDGQQASVTGPAGTTRYQYDGNGRLFQVTDPAGHAAHYHFDAQGRLSSVDSPNGVVDSFSYDPSSLLTGRDASNGTTTIGQSDYTIDPATAQRSSATDLDGTSTFTYQDNGWLTQATHPDASGLGNETYTYDGAGNITSTADVPAAQVGYTAGRLTQFGGTGLAYDAEGNLISKTDTTTGKVTRYHWNTDHELTSLDLPDGSTVRYSYDPLRRRVQSCPRRPDHPVRLGCVQPGGGLRRQQPSRHLLRHPAHRGEGHRRQRHRPRCWNAPTPTARPTSYTTARSRPPH